MSLKSRREALGLTQEDVAAMAGVHPNYYSQIERGRVKWPDPDLRRAISKALRMRHVDFMIEVGQLEEWELPGFSPTVSDPDPEVERLEALLAQVDLRADRRAATLAALLEMFRAQDRQRQAADSPLRPASA